MSFLAWGQKVPFLEIQEVFSELGKVSPEIWKVFLKSFISRDVGIAFFWENIRIFLIIGQKRYVSGNIGKTLFWENISFFRVHFSSWESSLLKFCNHEAKKFHFPKYKKNFLGKNIRVPFSWNIEKISEIFPEQFFFYFSSMGWKVSQVAVKYATRVTSHILRLNWLLGKYWSVTVMEGFYCGHIIWS